MSGGRNHAIGLWFAVFMIGFAITRLTIDVWRPGQPDRHPGIAFALGIAPNFVAALTLPALGMMLREYLVRSAAAGWLTGYEAWNRVTVGLTVLGLVGWEYRQRSGYLTFDYVDILATLLGAGLAYLGTGYARRWIA
jgi:hypothetical protein